MCGIAGVLATAESGLAKLNTVRSMVQRLAHRGPDGAGIYECAPAALGHRRLSIIDLSDNARQPMLNEDGSLALVFNGEIYNFRDLRKRLELSGHRFRSATDSEVILHLYEEYGDDCVKYLEGMFAFAIYDSSKRQLYLARDRLGEKPLYYYQDQSAFYFASEIKSFAEVPGFRRQLSNAGTLHYFNYIQIPAPWTIFEGVEKLPAAHWMTVDGLGKRRLRAYWHLHFDRKKEISEEGATETLSGLMYESVSKMLVSDVPVGLLLSGGVDSSLILAIAKDLGADIRAFTVYNSRLGTGDDEYKRAKQAASRFGTELRSFDFGTPAFGELVEAVSKCDEPIGILEIFYMFGIYRKIGGEAKVILTGNGADEVFGGYRGYSLARSLAPLPPPLDYLVSRNNEFLDWLAGSAYVLRNGFILRRLLEPSVFSLERNTLCAEPLSRLAEIATYDNLLDAKLFMDLMVLCNHSISSIPDTASMSSSVESRSPFLHHKIIEFAAALPPHLKVRDRRNPLFNKYVVKRLLARYMGDSEVFVRKYGFGYFINSFDLMRNEWRDDVERSLFDADVVGLGLFKKSAVMRMWHSFLADALSFRERLIFVRYLTFCLWFRHSFLSFA